MTSRPEADETEDVYPSDSEVDEPDSEGEKVALHEVGAESAQAETSEEGGGNAAPENEQEDHSGSGVADAGAEENQGDVPPGDASGLPKDAEESFAQDPAEKTSELEVMVAKEPRKEAVAEASEEDAAFHTPKRACPGEPDDPDSSEPPLMSKKEMEDQAFMLGMMAAAGVDKALGKVLEQTEEEVQFIEDSPAHPEGQEQQILNPSIPEVRAKILQLQRKLADIRRGQMSASRGLCIQLRLFFCFFCVPSCCLESILSAQLLRSAKAAVEKAELVLDSLGPCGDNVETQRLHATELDLLQKQFEDAEDMPVPSAPTVP